MKKFALFMILVIATGVLAGCGDGGGDAAVDKAAEIEAQTKAAGGDPQKP